PHVQVATGSRRGGRHLDPRPPHHLPRRRDQPPAPLGKAHAVSDPNAGVSRLNSLPPSEAAAALHACCASKRWVERMTARRPFVNPEAVLAEAERIWLSL